MRSPYNSSRAARKRARIGSLIGTLPTFRS
jgi:hypothetical protein